jgi:hypothetical protein
MASKHKVVSMTLVPGGIAQGLKTIKDGLTKHRAEGMRDKLEDVNARTAFDPSEPITAYMVQPS